MNTRDVWQTLRDELKSTLPAITYELNIEKAHLLSVDANTYCIGVPSLSAKKYCEMRLTGQIARFLKTIYGEQTIPYNVRFEVISEDDILEKTTDEQNVIEKESVDPSLDLTFLPSYEGVYESTVNPTRVIVLPGYFIEHLPYLGPQAGWVYTACFQLSFFNNHPKTSIPIRAKDAVRWSGLSKNTFWKQIGENSYLKHFVKLERDNVPTGTQSHYVDDKGRKYRHVTVNQEVKLKREANRYFVQHTMPLTPADAEALKLWLINNKFITQPIEALRKALQTPVKELLGYSDSRKKSTAGTIADETQKPEFLVNLIHELLPKDKIQSTTALIQPLIDSLQNQIMLQFGHVFIPWYFVENWVSLMGAQKAWAVMLARKRCYQNVDTGEVRNVFTYAHGFPELAHYLRVKNPQSISLWFKDSNTRAGKPNFVNLFLRLANSIKQKDQSVSRQFETVMNDLISPKDLHSVLFSATVNSLILSIRKNGQKCLSHILITTDENLIHLLPLSFIQNELISEFFHESSENHILNDANQSWEVNTRVSEKSFKLPKINDSLSNRFSKLGYDNCALHTPVNESGTFIYDSNNEFGMNTQNAINELKTFKDSPIIELEPFLTKRVNELKTILTKGVDEIETIKNKGDNEFETSLRVGIDEYGTILKYLIKFISGSINSFDSSKLLSSNYQDDKPLGLSKVAEGEDPKFNFDFKNILDRCNVSYVKQVELRDTGVTIQALISMLLFVASPRGERLGMGYVITRLLENPKGLTDNYGELASLEPQVLLSHIENALRIDTVSEYEWRIVMGGAQDMKLQELLYRLLNIK